MNTNSLLKNKLKTEFNIIENVLLNVKKNNYKNKKQILDVLKIFKKLYKANLN